MRMLSDSPAAVDASSAPLLVTPASVAAATVGGPPAGGSNDASFDADMVVILAAMLCVLVGLNSLLIPCLRLHCVGRRTRITTVAAVPAATAVDAGAGLKKRELNLRWIPVVVYDHHHQVNNNKAAGVSATDDECAICLGEFEDGDKVRVLPRCCHGFHVHCIDVWLAKHPSCPTCRDSLLLEDDGASKATVAGEETFFP